MHRASPTNRTCVNTRLPGLAGLLGFAMAVSAVLLPMRAEAYSIWTVRQPNTGNLLNVHWAELETGLAVPYVIDPEGTSQPGSLDREFAIIQEGHNRWTRIPSATVKWSPSLGAGPLFVDPFDGVNIVTFNTPFDDPNLGPGVIGYSQPTFDNVTGEYLDNDIVLNDFFPFIFSPEEIQDTNIQEGLISLAGVVTHEVGHRLGIGHTFVRDAIMWPFIQPRMNLNPPANFPDDVAAVTTLYPAANASTLFGSITGRAVEAERQIPVTGAHIVAIDAATHRPMVSAFTDLDGRYRIDNLPPGAYVLRNETSEPLRVWDLYFPGYFQQVYQSKYYGNTQARDDARVVIVLPGIVVPEINFDLASAYSKDSWEDDNKPSQANPVRTDGTPDIHNFYPPGDIDWFSFEAVAGRTYRLSVSNIEYSDFNPYFFETGEGIHSLRLFDRDGQTVLAQNTAFDPFFTNEADNPWNNVRSRIEWTAPQSGTYYSSVQNMELFIVFYLNFVVPTFKSQWGPATSYSFDVRELNAPLPTPTPGITPTPIPTATPVPHALPQVALVSPGEGPMAVLGLDLHDDESRPRLTEVTVRITNQSALNLIAPNSFLPLTRNEESGISIWADGGTGGPNATEGGFDENTDTVLVPLTTPVLKQNGDGSFDVTFRFSPDNGAATLLPGRPDGVFDFFVVVRLANRIRQGDAFSVQIPAQGIQIESAVSSKRVYTTPYPAVPKTIHGDIIRLVNFVNPPVFNDDDAPEDREEQSIGANSPPVPVMGINAAGPASEDYRIEEIVITVVPVKSFTRGDLLPLTEDEFSGISLWRDAPGSEDGLFEPDNDEFVTVVLPTYERGPDYYTVRLRPEEPLAVPVDDVATGNRGADYFICVRTSDRIRFGDIFRLEMRYDAERRQGPVILNNGISTARVMTKTSFPPTHELKAKPIPSFTFYNLIEPGQRIPYQSKTFPVLGISANDHGADVFEIGDNDEVGYILEQLNIQMLKVPGRRDFTLSDLRPILGVPNVDPAYFETDLGVYLVRDDSTGVGNQFDDDGDGFTDEELFDNMDNDRDGLTDEDLGDFDAAGVTGQFDALDDVLAQFPGNHWPASNTTTVGHFTPPLVTPLANGTGWDINFDMRFFRSSERHLCQSLFDLGAHPYDGQFFKGPGSVLDSIAHTFSNLGGFFDPTSVNTVFLNNSPIFFTGEESVSGTGASISIKGEQLYVNGNPCGFATEDVTIGEGTAAIVLGQFITGGVGAEVFANYNYYYEIPNDNTGPNAGPDYYVVVRTSDTAAHGDAFKFRINTGAITYSQYVTPGLVGLSPGSSDGFIETNALTVERPINVRFHKLTQPGQKIDFESDPLPVIGLDLDVGGSLTRVLPGDSEEFLFEVTVEIIDEGGFSPEVLLPVTTSAASGIALYRDSGPQHGVFEPNADELIPLSVGINPGDVPGSGTDADPYVYKLTADAFLPVPYDNNGTSAGVDYFITLRSSSALRFQDAFRVRVRRSGLEGTAPIATTPSQVTTDIIRGDLPLLVADVSDLTNRGQEIKAANLSPQVPIFAINAQDNGAGVTLTQIAAEFESPMAATPTPGSGTDPIVTGVFTRTDIANPASDPSSGIALYKDDGDGIFNPSRDTFVPMSKPIWSGMRLTMAFTPPAPIPDDDVPPVVDYFVVVRPSSTISDGEQFRLVIPEGGISFGAFGDSKGVYRSNVLTARISPRIQLTQPSRSELYTSLNTVNVAWTFQGNNAFVRIYYVDIDQAAAQGLSLADLRRTPLDADHPLLRPISDITAADRAQFPWSLAGVGNGSYIVYAIIDNTNLATDFGRRDAQTGFVDYGYSYSSGIVTVNNPPPGLVVVKPNAPMETPPVGSTLYTIVYDATFTSQATLRVSADPLDGGPSITIAQAIPLANSPVVGGQVVWNLSLVPNGEYRIRAQISDGNSVRFALSPGTILVDRAASFQSGWPVAVSAAAYASPVLADIDGQIVNGLPDYEAIFAIADGTIVVLKSDGTDLPGFPVQLGSVVLGSPAVADLDLDGSKEIIAVTADGKVFILNADGTTDVNRDGNPATPEPVIQLPGEFQNGPAIGNLASDNGLEIALVAGRVPAGDTQLARVTVLSATGVVIAEGDFAATDRVSAGVAIGDLTGDGAITDLVVASSLGIHAWTYAPGTLAPLTQFNGLVTDRIVASPVLADLDGIPGDEVIIGTNTGQVAAYNSSGALVAGFPVTLSAGVDGSPSVGRLAAGDTQPSLVVGTLDSVLHVISDTGGAYAETNSVKLAGRIRSSVAIADIGGSTAAVDQEIAVTTENGFIYVLRHDLKGLDGLAPSPIFSVNGEIRTTPAVLSLDRDGDVEIVFGAASPNFVHAIDIPQKSHADPEWPMWRRDPAHSGRWLPFTVLKPAVYVLDAVGNIFDQDGAPVADAPYFAWAIARALQPSPDGNGLYVLDGFGAIHAVGGAESLRGQAYFGWDIARDLALLPGSDGVLLLDGFGGVYAINGDLPGVTPYFGWDIARAIVASPDGKGYYVLDGFGGIHSAGGAPSFPSGIYFGWDIARDLEIAANGAGLYMLDGFGGIHAMGAAAPTDGLFFGKDAAVGLGADNAGILWVLATEGDLLYPVSVSGAGNKEAPKALKSALQQGMMAPPRGVAVVEK